MKINITIILFLLFTLLLVTPLLAEDDEEVKIKHPKKTVLERKLVGEKANAKQIIKENKNYVVDTDKKNFEGATLAYVTPWNNHGYDLAKIFNNKFTYVSPVWLQVKMGEKIRLGGLHDIDQGWMKEVKSNSFTKIVPRFLFEHIYNARDMFNKVDEIKQLIVSTCESHKFDGVVLDGLSGLLGGDNGGEAAQEFVKAIANALHNKKMEIILVVPPSEKAFNADDFAAYINFVDRISLMTYDYSNFQNPGPVAPLPWVLSTAKALAPGDNAHKLLLGLNFYGFDFTPREKSGDAIVGETYLQLLKKYNPKITWESTYAEHSFTYEDKGRSHLVYYPTLKSVYDRISVAKSMGYSIAIWEIGQGLDYFYDFL